MKAIAERQTALEENANLRAGLIAATIVNAAPRKKGARAVRPEDFFRRRTKPQTPGEMERVLDALAARQNRERSH